jgi:anti-anti-sigma factor
MGCWPVWLMIDSTAHDGIVVARLYGEFDYWSATHLETSLFGAVCDHPPLLVVDMSAVTFFDCASVRVLADMAQALHDREGCLVVSGVSTPVDKVLSLTGYAEAWPVSDAEPAAVEQVARYMTV